MANVDTPVPGYPHIIIRNDPDKNPTFHLTVLEQLALIASKPIGKKLLKAISEGKGAPSVGYKVAIMRADNKVDLTTQDAKWSGGNVCVRVSEEKAGNGQGSPSAIKYNPNLMKTPDGERPPWVGLAHELCHALHNIQGTAKVGNDLIRSEEEVTVGLGEWAADDKAINENNIRKEHGIKKRKSYT